MLSKVILGTAQFGMNYGINNNKGKVSVKEIFKILDYCAKIGINYIDTAFDYGDSESTIGQYLKNNSNVKFKIITKVSHSSKNIEDSLFKSLSNLKVDSIDTILFHSKESFNKLENEIGNLIGKHKNLYFSNFGVSVYSNEDVYDILKYDFIDTVQLPFNIFDNYNYRENVFKELNKKNIKLLVRSIFLQGLFFKPVELIPRSLRPLKPALIKLNELSKKYNLTINELSLSYVFNQNIDGILIGCDSLKQLKENIKSLKILIDHEIIDEIEKIKINHISMLDPRNWKL